MANKESYAEQCKEDIALKMKIKDILLRKTRIGFITNELFYLMKDEIKKSKAGGRE